jgi:hypothetical protein
MLKSYAGRIGLAVSVLGSLMLVSGCSDDDGNGPNEGTLRVAMAEDESGNGQTGEVSERLADRLRVVVTRGDEPAPDVEVEWATGGGGSFTPTSSRTDDVGVATTFWTLGPIAGPQSAQATVTDAEGSPVEFTATAEGFGAPPPPGGPSAELRSRIR